MPLSLSHYTETRNHNKRTSLKRLGILVGFVLLLVLLVCNAVILRRELKIQIDNQGRVTHTEQVLTELKKTESLLEVAETGQRGFLYTGDPKYLEHYNLAIEQVEPHLDVLDQLTVGNPNQRARLFALRVLALEKLDELGQTVSLYSSNRADEAKAIVLSDAGLVGIDRTNGSGRKCVEGLPDKRNAKKHSRDHRRHLSGLSCGVPGCDSAGVLHLSGIEPPRTAFA